MKNLILISLLALGLFACGTEEDSLPVNQEADVELTLWQTLPVTPNNLQLLITNTEAIDCINTEMLYEYSQPDNTAANLQINGFIIPADCIDGEGYVTTAINFGNEMERLMNITNKGVLSEGKIKVDAVAMSIEFLEENHFTVRESTINRIPEGLVWGYIDSTPDETVDINTLLQMQFPDVFIDAVAVDLATGYYGHFTFDMDPTIDRYVLTEVDGETELDQTILFRFGSDRWSELSDFLIEVGIRFPGFHYTVFNSDGFVLRG